MATDFIFFQSKGCAFRFLSLLHSDPLASSCSLPEESNPSSGAGRQSSDGRPSTLRLWQKKRERPGILETLLLGNSDSDKFGSLEVSSMWWGDYGACTLFWLLRRASVHCLVVVIGLYAFRSDAEQRVEPKEKTSTVRKTSSFRLGSVQTVPQCIFTAMSEHLRGIWKGLGPF